MFRSKFWNLKNLYLQGRRRRSAQPVAMDSTDIQVRVGAPGTEVRQIKRPAGLTLNNGPEYQVQWIVHDILVGPFPLFLN
jgi:hypothetical protein